MSQTSYNIISSLLLKVSLPLWHPSVLILSDPHTPKIREKGREEGAERKRRPEIDKQHTKWSQWKLSVRKILHLMVKAKHLTILGIFSLMYMVQLEK